MVHVQSHSHTGKFDDGVVHPATRSTTRWPEIVSPSRLECAGEDTCAVQHDRVEAVAIFDPQSAISSRATHRCFSLSTTGSAGSASAVTTATPWLGSTDAIGSAGSITRRDCIQNVLADGYQAVFLGCAHSWSCLPRQAFHNEVRWLPSLQWPLGARKLSSRHDTVRTSKITFARL
jgi:hypothetical protein